MISAMLTLGSISALGIAMLLWADRRYPEDRDSLPAIIDQLLPKHSVPNAVMAGADLMPRPSLKAHPSIFVHRAARL